jgi:hypothetical protein
VDGVLFNVCPNCGGGFVARYDREEVARFAEMIRDIPPESR